MDIKPFFVEFLYDGEWVLAEIKPCCNEENVFYYDVSINNVFQFTITPGATEEDSSWKVSLMNADKEADPLLVEAIGEEIDRHYLV